MAGKVGYWSVSLDVSLVSTLREQGESSEVNAGAQLTL